MLPWLPWDNITAVCRVMIITMTVTINHCISPTMPYILMMQVFLVRCTVRHIASRKLDDLCNNAMWLVSTPSLTIPRSTSMWTFRCIVKRPGRQVSSKVQFANSLLCGRTRVPVGNFQENSTHSLFPTPCQDYCRSELVIIALWG